MLHSAMERGKHYRAECRVYKCDQCRQYHLTSMTLEEYEAKMASQDYMNPN